MASLPSSTPPPANQYSHQTREFERPIETETLKPFLAFATLRGVQLILTIYI